MFSDRIVRSVLNITTPLHHSFRIALGAGGTYDLLACLIKTSNVYLGVQESTE